MILAHSGETVLPTHRGDWRGGGVTVQIDYNKLAQAMANVHLSVDVDGVHSALLRKERSNAGLFRT